MGWGFLFFGKDLSSAASNHITTMGGRMLLLKEGTITGRTEPLFPFTPNENIWDPKNCGPKKSKNSGSTPNTHPVLRQGHACASGRGGTGMPCCLCTISHSRGGATPRFWTPTSPPTNCWPEAPWGGGSGRRNGGGGIGGAGGGGGAPRESVGGGVQVGQFGVVVVGGGSRWGDLGCWGGRGRTGSPYLPLPSL